MSNNSNSIFSQDFSDDEWCEENLPEIEFRSQEDEAWYSVKITDICDALLVSFDGFSYEHDEFYPADGFKNTDEIHEFEERFRVSSVQMQDEDCKNVIEGIKVCATSPSVTGEVKFFDAIVVAVERKKHVFDEKGNEVCDCDFRLYWKQGTWMNQVTSVKVGDICLRPNDNRMNPKVVSFLKEAKKKLCGEASNKGEETEWEKILEKVKSAIRNYNLDSSDPKL